MRMSKFNYLSGTDGGAGLLIHCTNQMNPSLDKCLAGHTRQEMNRPAETQFKRGLEKDIECARQHGAIQERLN